MDAAGIEGDVSFAVDDGVGTIEFSHPKGNSMPGILLRRLAAGVEALANDPAARVIVLGSAGAGPFCAGASFDELVNIENEQEGQEFFLGFARATAPRASSSRPSSAACSRAASKGGRIGCERAPNTRQSDVPMPSALNTEASAGTSTRRMPSSRAQAPMCTGPAPP